MNFIVSILTGFISSTVFEAIKSIYMSYKKNKNKVIIVGAVLFIVGVLAGAFIPDKWNPMQLFKKKTIT